MNASTNANGETVLIDGKPPLDPATNLIYNDELLNFNDATVACNKMCSHLATFQSQEDQHEAEAYFIGQVRDAAGPLAIRSAVISAVLQSMCDQLQRVCWAISRLSASQAVLHAHYAISGRVLLINSWQDTLLDSGPHTCCPK